MSGTRRALCCLLAALLAAGAGAAHGQSALDGFDPNANDTVRIVVVQPDGKILLGGAFTTLAPNGGPVVTRNHIARLNPDGTLDAAFDPNANNIVVSLVVQPDGKILAGGFFTSMSGLTRTSIARLDATTGQADSFDPGTNAFGAVVTIALQADGKILAGGFFTTIGGQSRNHIARLDPITGQADSFNPNPTDVNPQDWVTGLAVQRDGKILVGGFFSAIGGQSRNYIARLSPVTGLADSFDPNADGPVGSFAVQADGKILVVGVFNRVSGQTRHRMARLDRTTGLADSFDPNADSQVFAIAVQADGKILASGGFRNIGGQSRFGIARLNATTGQADSFDPRADPHGFSVALVTTLTLQADGKVLVGGDFSNLAPNGGADVSRNRIARLETDGRLDRTIDLNFAEDRDITTIVVQPDGKILLGGGFSTVLGVARHNIARLNTDGTLDLDFDPDASSQVNTIVLQPDGKILLGGIFTKIGGQTRNNVARIDGVTGLADSFDPNVGPNFPFGEGVGAIVVQRDGKILLGGSFNSVSGQVRHNIARVDPTTGQPDSFDPDGNNGVSAIALQADCRILVGGDFTSIGGQTRRRLARLSPTTGLADAFDPNASCCFVAAIVVQPDGKILVGGNFDGANSIGGQTRNYLARLDATTGLADSFDPNSDGPVLTMAVQADGKILVGGQFRTIGGQKRSCFARLDAITGLADSFDPNVDQAVLTMVIQADGKILVGGSFDLVGGQLRRSFVRLSNDTAAMQSLAVTPTTVTWVRRGSSQRMARVTFEYSFDNVNYTSLGEGTVAGSNWVLTNLNLPTGVGSYIRAQGHHNGGDASNSITESVRKVLLQPAAQAINLSTRMRVQTGDNVGIAGFIITGTAAKHVLLRAIGPSLAPLGVPDALADPVLELRGPGSFATITNDNWKDDPAQELLIRATGIPPANDLESAIDAVLMPGAYTAVVSGRNNTSGVALVEVYDLNPPVASKLANTSTRAFVGTGNDIVIAGFILDRNEGSDRIVLRGIGPSLTTAGIPAPLADPVLELRDGNGLLLAANNDWQDDPTQGPELAVAGLAPANNRESAIAITLPPGSYTALLSGLNQGSGVGLVEVYDLGP